LNSKVNNEKRCRKVRQTMAKKTKCCKTKCWGWKMLVTYCKTIIVWVFNNVHNEWTLTVLNVSWRSLWSATSCSLCFWCSYTHTVHMLLLPRCLADWSLEFCAKGSFRILEMALFSDCQGLISVISRHIYSTGTLIVIKTLQAPRFLREHRDARNLDATAVIFLLPGHSKLHISHWFIITYCTWHLANVIWAMSS
jgi:hypothetical protein